jgi:hypothetical protein
MRNDFKIIDALSQPDNSISMNYLVETCQKIALSYLHFNYKKVFRFLNSEDLTIDEFALDAIAHLFTRENGEENISLKVSYIKWDPPIKSEADALYFLNKVVSHRVEQHIFSFLRADDPIFSKILDSVTYLINHQSYKKIHSFGKTYIVALNYEPDKLRFINSIEFDKLPGFLFKDKRKLLESLLNYFKNETDFVPAIPLNELIYKLKHISISSYLTTEASEESRKKFELDELIDYAMSKSIEKLNKSYLVKGKLTGLETDSIQKALQGLCEDLKNGGINPGLYYYLLPHMSNLTKEVYRTDYHNILEYLFKVTKSIIAEHLIEKK